MSTDKWEPPLKESSALLWKHGFIKKRVHELWVAMTSVIIITTHFFPVTPCFTQIT